MSHRNMNLWSLLRNRRSGNNRLHSHMATSCWAANAPCRFGMFSPVPTLLYCLPGTGTEWPFFNGLLFFSLKTNISLGKYPHCMGRQNVDKRLSVQRQKEDNVYLAHFFHYVTCLASIDIWASISVVVNV